MQKGEKKEGGKMRRWKSEKVRRWEGEKVGR